MRIQLTGMNPRTASERARGQVTFARTLQAVLTELGHEVTRASVAGEFDLVLVGVTSPLSPGASYALTGLGAIGRAVQEGTPLLLFVDDPALDKTRSGALSAQRDLTRLYSDYLMGKRVHAVGSPAPVEVAHIETAIDVLAGEYWPTTLLPMHPWGSAAIASKRLGVLGGVVALDLSPVNAPGAMPEQRAMLHAPLWLTNQHYSKQTLNPDRVAWPVIPVDSSTLADPVRVYAAARGVHQGLTARIPGWWTPTPLQVAQARTVYLCSTEESVRMGADSPYYLTPDLVEAFDDGAHTMLAEAQAAYLEEITWNLETLSSVLTDLIGRASSFATPGTSSPPPPTS